MKKLVVALLLGALSVAAFASPDTDSVLATLKQKYPRTNFTKVDATPLPGIYEVTMGRNITYSDKEGHYFLFGSLYDMVARQDLTAPKRDALQRVDVSQLPLKDAIVRVKGDGSRKIFLFSDPDCPFCKKLETDTLNKLNNVTIYTFLFPIAQLHPNAPAKAQSIWCQPEKDRAAAWEKALTQGIAPTPATCDNPLAEIQKIGEGFDIHGTPTLISADGRVMPGAAPVERIEAWLNGAN